MKVAKSQKASPIEVEVQRGRPIRAILVCLAIGVLLCGILFSSGRAEGTGQSDGFVPDRSASLFSPTGTYSSAIWSAITSSCDLVGELESMGFIVWSPYVASNGEEDNQDSVWDSISKEITNLDAYEQCVAEPAGALVCLLSKQQKEDAIAQLDEALSARGWLNATAGDDSLRTYIKEKGEYRWLLVETLGVEGETSIVLHIQRV